MNVWKDAWKVLKAKFFALMLLQLGLFFASLFFLVFVKEKLQGYMLAFQEHQGVINAALAGLEGTDPAAIVQSQALVASLTEVANQAMWFAFVIVPLVLLLIWVVFQGLSWRLYKKKSFKTSRTYWLQFAIPTTVLFALLVWFMTRVRDAIQFFSSFDVHLTKLLVATFVVLYLLTVYYAVIQKKAFKPTLKKSLSLAVKKSPIFVPLFVPLFLNSLFLFSLLMIFLTQQFMSSFFYLELLPLLLFTFLSLFFGVYWKIVWQQKITEAS